MPDDTAVLIQQQNQLLSNIEARLSERPSRFWKVGKGILWIALTVIALVPGWDLLQKAHSSWEQRESFKVLVSVGDVLLTNGHVEEARKRYSEALSLKPGDKNTLIKFTETNIRVLLPKYENIHRTLRPEERKEVEQLASDSTLLAQTVSGDAHVLRLQGLAFQLAGHLDESVESFQTALRINPNDYEAYNQLGVTYLKMDRLDKAKDCFDNAIKLASDKSFQYARAYNNRGFTFLQQRQFEAAKLDLDKSIEIDSSYYSPYLNRGRLETELAQSKGGQNSTERARLLASAMQDLLRAITLNPEVSDAHYDLANLFFQERRWEAAATYYAKAESLDPDAPDIHENMGAALAMLSRDEEAARQFSLAIGLAPGKRSAYLSRALVYRRLGKSEKAQLDEAVAAILQGMEKPLEKMQQERKRSKT